MPRRYIGAVFGDRVGWITVSSYRCPTTGQYAVRPGAVRVGRRKVKDPSPPISTDGRRLYARRIREIERGLRSAIEQQGRIVDIGLSHRIAAAATLAVQVEVIRVKRAHGEEIHDEVVTRYLFGLDRALNRLGLKPSVLAPAPPKPAPKLSAIVRQQTSIR